MGRENESGILMLHSYINISVLNKQRLPITVLKIDQTVKQDLSIKAEEIFFLKILAKISLQSRYKSLMTVTIA